MAGRRLSANDQCQVVVSEIIVALKENIPELRQHTDRGFVFEFTIHIRDGVIARKETDTWDDAFEPINHVRPQSIEAAIKQIGVFLFKDIPYRLVSGYHGLIVLRVNLLNDTLSFGARIRKQRQYDWV
jgi:hypothetical protein